MRKLRGEVSCGSLSPSIAIAGDGDAPLDTDGTAGPQVTWDNFAHAADDPGIARLRRRGLRSTPC